MPGEADRGSVAAELFIKQRLSLRQLRLLQALHQSNSLSAAADALHVTQPAVSKALSEMEDGVGQTLFERRGREMHATALGRRLLALADHMDVELCRASEDAGSIVRGTTGEMVIGASTAALAQLLPDALTAMKREYPLLTIRVYTHSLPVMLEGLREGRIDLLVAQLIPDIVPNGLESKLLAPQREVLTISSHHPLAQRPEVTWEELSTQAWIGQLPGTRMYLLQERMWQRLRLAPPTNVIATDDTLLALELMKREPLVALLPEQIARLAVSYGQVKILPLVAEFGMIELCVWHSRQPQRDVVKRFKALLHEAAA